VGSPGGCGGEWDLQCRNRFVAHRICDKRGSIDDQGMGMGLASRDIIWDELNQLDSRLNQLLGGIPITRLTVHGRRIDFLLSYSNCSSPSPPLSLNSPSFLFYTVRG
jgi:hypothetical protein